MYAIRSYYVLMKLHFATALGKVDAASALKARLQEKSEQGHLTVGEHRITSYNVCYTKLLRLARPCRRDTTVRDCSARPGDRAKRNNFV